MNAQTRMNAYAALSTAEAAKEYQSTLGEDNEAIENSRKEKIFSDLVSELGKSVCYSNTNNDRIELTYSSLFDNFTVEAKGEEFNALSYAVQKLREAQEEAKSKTDKEAAYKCLLAKVEAFTSIIDNKAISKINDEYERICEDRDGPIHYAA